MIDKREHMEMLRSEIQWQAEGELAWARLNHGETFASVHEAESVIHEEITEANTEMLGLKSTYELLWQDILADEESLKGRIARLKHFAVSCAAELIQVVAMCDKYLEDVNMK